MEIMYSFQKDRKLNRMMVMMEGFAMGKMIRAVSYTHLDVYKRQAKKFEEAGLTALLGSGFDPGVTQAYCAYAKKHEFDTIDTIDILDCNGGDHGYAFATNFNPEINLREVSAQIGRAHV